MDLQQSNKTYHTGQSIIYSCQYHVVFCPKYRRKVLTEEVAARLKELIKINQTKYGYIVMEMDIMIDHVHIMIDVDPRIGVYAVIRKIKAVTSHVLREEFPWLKKRIPTLWTHSKFISTVGAVALADISQYIEGQKYV